MRQSPRELCGKWMARAGDYCGLSEGHKQRCRTEAAVRNLRLGKAVRNARSRVKRQAAIDAYKLAHGCEECGYAENPVALDFDHKNPAEKTGKVSRLMYATSWEAVLREIAKCRVLCANCHRIKTQQDWKIKAAISAAYCAETDPGC